MPLPSQGRSASSEQREISLSVLRILRHNRSSQWTRQTNLSIKSPAMKAMRRAGGFADCRVRLTRKSKCLCPSRKLQQPCVPWHRKTWEHRLWKETRSYPPPNTRRVAFLQCDPKGTVVNVQNDALADQIFQSAEFPQVRTERVAEKKKRNLETDTCSGDSQTSFNGDLAFIGEFRSWQSPGSCRASQRSMVSGT